MTKLNEQSNKTLDLGSLSERDRAMMLLSGDSRGAYSRVVQDVRPAEQVESEWDIVAETFVEEYRKRRDTANALIELPIFLNYINGRLNGARFLEVGCGSFYVGDRAFRHAEPDSAVGLDISSEMLRRAQFFLEKKEYKDKVQLLHAPIENSGLPDEEFDLIIAHYSLDNVPDLRRSLSEMYRMLKPGGSVYGLIKSPKRNELYALRGTGEYHPGYNSWYCEQWPGTGDKGIWARYMTEYEWLEEFNNAGFQTYLYPIDLDKNKAIDASVRGSNPDVRAKYLERPSGLIVVGNK